MSRKLGARTKKPPVSDRGLNGFCSSEAALGCWLELAFRFGGDEAHRGYAIVGLGLDAVDHCSNDPDADAAQQLGRVVYLRHLAVVAADRQNGPVAVLAE